MYNLGIYLKNDKKLRMVNLMKRVKDFLKKHKIITLIAIIVIIAITAIIAITLTLSKYTNYIDEKNAQSSIEMYQKSEDDNNIKIVKILIEMYQESKDTNNIKSENTKIIKDYDMNKHKFTFPNFGSYNQSNGMCSGFTVFEKLNYMKELKNIKPHYESLDGGKVEFSEIDENIDLGTIQIPYEEYSNITLCTSINKNKEDTELYIDGEMLYEKNMGNIQNFKNKVSNDKTANILNIVNYLQMKFNENRNENTLSLIKPNEYIDKENKDEINEYLESSREFEIKDITDTIDNDKPVIIGISGVKSSGHAVLAYGYTKINEDKYKIYVSDSNLPIIKDEMYLNKSTIEEWNNFVQNDVYILLKRGKVEKKVVEKEEVEKEVVEKEEEKWNFVYIPNLNRKLYGEYNSYIPGHYMEVYKNELKL